MQTSRWRRNPSYFTNFEELWRKILEPLRQGSRNWKYLDEIRQFRFVTKFYVSKNSWLDGILQIYGPVCPPSKLAGKLFVLVLKGQQGVLSIKALSLISLLIVGDHRMLWKMVRRTMHVSPIKGLRRFVFAFLSLDPLVKTSHAQVFVCTRQKH